MTTYNIFQYASRRSINIQGRFSLILVALLFFTLAITPVPECHSAIKTDNSIFLPLKINAATDTISLSETTDEAQQKALTPFGIKMLSRSETTKFIDYNQWPPSFSTLKNTQKINVDYIVIGSLTKSGHTISLDIIVYDLLDETSIKLFYKDGVETDLTAVMQSLIQEIISYTNHEAIITKISITGNSKIDSGAISHKINIKDGSPYNKKTIRNALKAVYKMGYFDDVKIRSVNSDSGKEIIFAVTEKDIVSQIIIEGEDKLEADKILEVVDINTNSIISDKNVKGSETNIKELYKEEGYHNTKVTSKLTHLKDGKVNVTFSIKEGSKVYIKDVTIQGNHAFSTKKLTKIIQTSEKGWLSWFTDSGVLNRDIIEQDAARLSSFYQDNGYIEVKIGKPEISKKGDWFYVLFNIDEGERYRVGTVDINGELIAEKAAILDKINIKGEKYFSRRTLREDILHITDFYAEKGFAFAEAQPTTNKDIANRRVNIVINIAKKDLIHINRIVVRGNTRTRDKIIRREMQVKETGIFNATALKTSQKRLERLGFFEDVKIDPEPTMENDKMDVIVNIKEKSTGNFSIGAGYSSVDSFMFMSEISQSNFLGKGQKISLQANLSAISKQYNLSFTEPHLADSKLMAGFDIYNWIREYDDFDKDSHGAGLRFGYPLKWHWKMYGGYSYDNTTLSNIINNPSSEIQDSLDINITSSVKLGFTRDTRDKRTAATTGTIYSFNTKYAGGPLGGDADFTKFDATISYYHPLPFDMVYHNKVAAGWSFANSSSILPVFEKYYLGGINTIRGFKNTEISPRDPITQEKIGGAKMWYTNFEIIFPLVEDLGLKGLVFLDFGNVYEESSSWDFADLKKVAGLGFRWLSPMGPLRLEWGYNLDPTDIETKSNWDFSMGGSF